MAKRERRTYAEIFLDVLSEISKGKQDPIGNKALREALDWEEDKYRRTKDQLLAEGRIRSGRGQGGSVSLVAAPGSKPLKLFVSYSHKDEVLRGELVKHLEPLRRANLIEIWHDGKLAAGDEWNEEIAKQIEGADIFIPLISVDFINSTYCYEKELADALERHQEGVVRIIPVILRRCLWDGTPLASLQALPKDAKPIVEWAHQDEALVNVAEGIRRCAKELIEEK